MILLVDKFLVFIRYFLVDYGLVTIINQKTGPFSSALSQNVRNFLDVIGVAQ